MAVNSLVCDCNIDDDFIKDLQNKISKSVGNKIFKKYLSSKFDVPFCFDNDLYLNILEYNNILERIKNCDSCFGDYKIEEIISVIKNKINKL